jgi:hypothetical protein
MRCVSLTCPHPSPNPFPLPILGEGKGNNLVEMLYLPFSQYWEKGVRGMRAFKYSLN